jgi:hypothetical protein
MVALETRQEKVFSWDFGQEKTGLPYSPTAMRTREMTKKERAMQALGRRK